MRLSGIRVWDGSGDAGLSTLSWDDGCITGLEPSGDDPWPELAIVPGLVDTHVHMLGHAGERGDPAGRDTFTWPLVSTREEQVLHVAANAQKAMRHGVTTLRDLAADEAQAAVGRVFDQGHLSGPRVLASGGVGMTAGHLDLFTPPAVRERPPTADSPAECRRLVRTWARAGLTGIKVYTSGGVLSIGDQVGWRNHTLEELHATVDEAHALGMLVAAHAHSAEGIRIALEIGADSIEHGTEMTPDVAAMLAERRVPVAPTLLINEMIARAEVPVAPEAQQAAAELVAARDEAFRDAARAGVRFVLGTDASGYFVEFGDQWDELRRMADVFDTGPEAVLRAATSDAADSIGLGAVTGRIAPGLGADFVVMRGRPWERVRDLSADSIVAVVCRGRVVAGALPVPSGST
ncbi:amidohydrolase family protein [Phytoactinopolyspora endophytica]|uniref:amidohydrolase family protein n=1 Tax=Phytoactinopolyspora endophytica TaxID=1642495 RepID=UPI0013EBDE1B|nr:amidohydrolase family protein [Phytoactinopolyspora endophytica]